MPLPPPPPHNGISTELLNSTEKTDLLHLLDFSHCVNQQVNKSELRNIYFL